MVSTSFKKEAQLCLAVKSFIKYFKTEHDYWKLSLKSCLDTLSRDVGIATGSSAEVEWVGVWFPASFINMADQQVLKKAAFCKIKSFI